MSTQADRINEDDVIDYIKAFTLMLDRDEDGVVTAQTLLDFFRKAGQEVDVQIVDALIRDLQLRNGCKKDVRSYFSIKDTIIIDRISLITVHLA